MVSELLSLTLYLSDLVNLRTNPQTKSKPKPPNPNPTPNLNPQIQTHIQIEALKPKSYPNLTLGNSIEM
jgi:hypothetical protein